ncbi:Crp/Fnr family transcriptional regulator, partial [Gemmatimonadota bacterium]
FRHRPEEGLIFGEDLRKKGIQIILEGEVKIIKGVGDDGEGIVLATLHRGEIIGEASMFDAVPHTASVETSEPATTISIARDIYFKLVEEKPHLAVKIANRAAAVLSDRLHQANETVYTYAIWSRSLSQSPPESFWHWHNFSTRENLITRDLDAEQEEGT